MMILFQTVIAASSVIIPKAPPPVKCDLYNNMNTATGSLIGNIRGLENFGPTIVFVLLAVAVILMLFPRPRHFIIDNLVKVIAVIVLGAVVGAAVLLFSPNSC